MMLESNSLREFTTRRAIDQQENEPLPDRKRGRKSIVSSEAIEKTRTHAEERDLAKDSATSPVSWQQAYKRGAVVKSKSDL